MVWATVSSRSCFCWLNRVSSSSAAKNIINLIQVLSKWWWPRVESSLALLEEGVCYDSVFSWQNSISLCPASFCTPRPNVPVTPGISWLPTFALQSPRMKKTSSLVLILEGLVGLHRTVQLQLLQHLWLRHRLVILNGLPWNRTEIILSFLRLHPSTAFWTLLLTVMATPFLLRDSCPQ